MTGSFRCDSARAARDYAARPRRSSARRVRWLVAGMAWCLARAVAAAVSCSVSTPGLSFLGYDVFAPAALTSSATLSVRCTSTTATTVNYLTDLSTGSSLTFVQRTMTSGGNTLGYNVYTTSAGTTVWGDGSAGTARVAGSMSLAKNQTKTNTHTAWGRVPALQNAAVGTYSDSVTITVTY
jgi:spore coat protein U-like protein